MVAVPRPATLTVEPIDERPITMPAYVYEPELADFIAQNRRALTDYYDALLERGDCMPDFELFAYIQHDVAKAEKDL